MMRHGDGATSVGAHSAVVSLATALAAAWMMLRWPLPLWMLSDSDWVHQLGGAAQILHGEHPFIDWHTDYGPLRYYPSALAQWLFGRCTLSELALVTAAYAAAYGLLFDQMWRASRSRVIAAVLLFVALMLAPRLYKYYVVLGPLLCLSAAWREIDRPSTGSLVGLAAALTLMALFRADFGVFGGAAALIAILTGPPSLAQRLRRLAQLGICILLFAAPWLLWLWWRGGLLTYLADTALNGPGHAGSMALPFPSFDGSQPLHAPNNVTWMLFVCFYALPPLTLLVALWPAARREPAERRRIVAAVALAQGVLLHAAHRSDYSHMLQAIAPCFVLCAWLAGRLWRPAGAYGARARIVRVGAAAGLTGAVLVAVAAGVGVGGWPSPYAGIGLLAWREHALQPAALLERLAAQSGDTSLVQAMRYLQRCAAPTDHIVALPPDIGAYYFSDRPFGGGLPAWSPGFFSSAADQRDWIDTVRRQRVPLIIGDGSNMLDNRLERRFDRYSPLIMAYVDTAYVEIGRFGTIPVRALRGSRLPVAWESGAAPPCPIAPGAPQDVGAP